MKFSVSYTTRQPRPGEVNNVDYTFVSRNDFKLMIDEGKFVEWAEVHGELYGTSRGSLEEIVNSGFDAVLDIDTQGAMQLKEKYKDGVYIFILPPSIEILKERLEKRMSDSKLEIEKRMKKTLEEIKNYEKYDYVIVNDLLDVALRKLQAIVIAERSSIKRIDREWIEEKFF